MRRFSLILLVLFVLVFNTLMQKSAEAHPLMNPTLWDLRHALPCGISGVALCLAALGMGAQFWRGILPACGAEWAPLRSWSRMAAVGLWCGWIPLLCAIPFFPWAEEPTLGAPSTWFVGCFFALILSRMLMLLCKHEFVGFLAGLFTTAVALVCGQFLWPSMPFGVLVIGLSAALALHLLITHDTPPPLMWLLVFSLALCAYVAAFGHLLAFYPPGRPAAESPWNMWMAGAYTLLALALAVLPPLRHAAWGQRLAALLCLLIGTVWLWLHLNATLTPAEQLPALGIFAAALALLATPFGMMIAARR